MQQTEVTWNISTKTIFKLLAIGLGLYVVYLVWNILLLLFVALILATLIDPFAHWLEEKKIPRGLAVIIVYIGLFGLIGLAIFLLAPILAQDLPQFYSNIKSMVQGAEEHEIWRGVMQWFGLSEAAVPAGDTIRVVPSTSPTQVDSAAIWGVFTTISGLMAGVFSLLLVLVITFYLVVQEDPLKKILNSVVPDQYVPYFSRLIKEVRDKLGFWLRGQLVLSVAVGCLVGVGLGILDIKYAAVLGLLAALLEFVPYVGPILAAIPAGVFAFSQGGAWKLIAVILLYIIIQQLENHILVPKIMQRAVGLNPIVSIVAILIGYKLAGVVGALLAIPVATALSVIIKDVLAKQTIE